MNTDKIDLGRMQSLLDGFRDDEQVVINKKDNCEESKNIKLKDLKLTDADNTFEINHEDLMLVFNNEGRVSGFANIVDKGDLYNDILKNISIDDFKNAKASIFTFVVNPEVSMFAIGDVMEKLHNDHLTGTCEVLFDVSTTIDLPVGKIGYKILITGIQE